MKSRIRSLYGVVIAVLALPVFMGLTACLPTFPVPIGDPEKSTIDPYISGVWLLDDDDIFYVFEPFDKRAWLLSAFDLSEDLESCEYEKPEEEALEEEIVEEDDELGYYDEVMANIVALGTECFEVEHGPGAIKAWRVKLGGEWFMTWEGKGSFSVESGFEEDEWMVFHIDTSEPGQLRLGWINMEHDGWDKLSDVDEEDVTRRAVEKIFRKHADEEDFYEDDAILIFHRVLPEHYGLIEDFIGEGMTD